MKFCYLTIVSKNKASLESAYKFLLKSSSLNSNMVTKFFEKKEKRSVITILKSPHVHKTAQEQFETRIFSKQLLVFSIYNIRYAFLIKKLIVFLFSDVRIKIKWVANQQQMIKSRVQILNLNNFRFNIFYCFFTQNFKLHFVKNFSLSNNYVHKLKNYVSIMDFYGECCFKICLDSSVGRVKD